MEGRGSNGSEGSGTGGSRHPKTGFEFLSDFLKSPQKYLDGITSSFKTNPFTISCIILVLCTGVFAIYNPDTVVSIWSKFSIQPKLTIQSSGSKLLPPFEPLMIGIDHCPEDLTTSDIEVQIADRIIGKNNLRIQSEVSFRAARVMDAILMVLFRSLARQPAKRRLPRTHVTPDVPQRCRRYVPAIQRRRYIIIAHRLQLSSHS